MHQRCRFPRSSRGFTLVELLIVVALIGVLAALALAGYRRYINSAQGSEVRVVFGMIRNGEENYKSEMLSYLNCSGTLTNYYPNVSPDDSRWAWERASAGDTRYTSPTNGWQMLSVHPDAPVRFGYAVVAGLSTDQLPAPGPGFVNNPTMPTNYAGAWYVIQATNKRSPVRPATLAITASFDNNIYMENEGN